jgi:hypothetical protein
VVIQGEVCPSCRMRYLAVPPVACVMEKSFLPTIRLDMFLSSLVVARRGLDCKSKALEK